MSDPLATRQDPPRGPRGGGPRPGGPRTVRRRSAPTGPSAPSAPGGPPPGNPLATQQDVRRQYVLPATPSMAWTTLPEKRRRRLGRLALLAILVLQAVLTLRLDNTAFQDEALYVYVGHLVWSGAPLDTYAGYFSGAPYLYPALVAPFDSAFGLAGARLLSLLLMLGTTALLYSFTRRLFEPRSALMGAACYAVVASTPVLGGLATYDALSVFLIAAALWTVVRFAGRAAAAVHLAALLCALAFAVKYASGIFLPSVAAFAFVIALPGSGTARALGRGAALAALTGLGIAAFVVFGGVSEGLRFTTTSRDEGLDDAVEVLRIAAEYGGIFLLIALFGAVMFWRRAHLEEIPGTRIGGPGPRVRLLLGAVLIGTALIAPFYHAHLNTVVALHKHLGYGLLFAAPLAGVGMSRMLGAHFRSPQFPIAAWLAVFAFGFAHAQAVYASWPDSTHLVKYLRTEVSAEGRYLSAVPQVPIYYLGTEQAPPENWTSTYGFTDMAAVKAGRFDLIILDTMVTPEVNEQIQKTIIESGSYRPRAKLKYDYGPIRGSYRIWVKAK